MKFDALQSESSSKTLRMPHQQEAVDRLNKYFNIDNTQGPQSGLLVMPTGSGKTFTTVRWLLNSGVANGYRVLWLVHRQELINQTYNEFTNQLGDLKNYGIKFLNIMPISGSPEHCKMSQTSRQDINICSIYSLASKNGMRFIRRMLGKPGEKKLIVVIDEAHHAIMPSYQNVLDRIDKINPNRILLGLTATPIRMSEQETIKLNKLFKAKEYVDKKGQEIKYKYIYEIALGQLIKTSFLSKPYYKYIQTEIKGDVEFDLSNEEIDFFNRFGDLTENLKRKLANSQSRNEIILQEYLNNKEKYGKTLIFAINQLHAEKLNELFTGAGIRTDYAISNRKNSQTVIRDFKENKFDVLINVQMLTEGTDVPNIKTIFLTRETNSDSLLMQMVGRGLRGPEAGGTENAYIVSFHDKWEKIRFWMKPEFVTEGINYDDSVTKEKDSIELGEDIEIIHDINTLELLKKLYDVMKINIISDINTDIIPNGWYTVFDEDNEIDANIIVYDDQVLGYQVLEDSIELIIDGKLNSNNIITNFFNNLQIKPDARDIELITQYIKENYKMPEYYTFEYRNIFDPKLISNKMIKEIDEKEPYEYWLKDYYDKNPILENLYRTFYAFKKTVLDTLKEYKDAEIRTIDDREEYNIIHNFYNLDELYFEIIDEYPKLINTNLNGISWSKKVYKSWFAICYKLSDGSYSIFVNSLLSSPNVSSEAIKYLIYHELLHANGLWKHDNRFRQEEWKYPNSETLDGELDELELKYNIDFKDLKKLRFENITLEIPGNEKIQGNIKESEEQDKEESIKNYEDNQFKFCRDCGNKLPIKSKYCDKCGTNVEYS